jgi:hypothetical protein
MEYDDGMFYLHMSPRYTCEPYEKPEKYDPDAIDDNDTTD